MNMVVLLLLAVLQAFLTAAQDVGIRRYLSTSFVNEPPDFVIFYAKYGKSIPCEVRHDSDSGTSKVRISWQILNNGHFVTAENIPNVRFVKPSGTLIFMPIDEGLYDERIHSTIYRCIATYEEGVLASRNVRVKSVLQKPADIQVLDSRAHVGSNCVLKCSLDQYHQDHYRVTAWTTEDGLIVLPVNAYAEDVQGTWPERKYIILSDGNLFIPNVSESDLKRRFRCQVKNQLTGERIESTQWIRILPSSKMMDHSPPQIIREAVQLRSWSVNQGETVVLHCPIQGWPRPNTTWTRHTTVGRESTSVAPSQVPDRFSGQIIVLRRVSSLDSGKYFCSASNGHGRADFEVDLHVRSAVSVALSASTKHPSMGQQVTINCSLVYRNSKSNHGNTKQSSGTSWTISEIVWIRNMHRISYDSRITLESDNLLHIRSFRSSDNGIYQCFMRTLEDEQSHNERWIQGSMLLRMAEREASFGTVFPEKVKSTGTELSLKCLAFGQPIPSIEWQIDGSKVSNGHRYNVFGYLTTDGKGYVSFLNISSLTIQDAGSYECIASNSMGTISHQARIDMIGPPGIKPMENMTAILGETYRLYCPYTGYPVDEVFFVKDDRRLSSDERRVQVGMGKLNFVPTTKEDTGLYKCVVSSLNGERYENLFHLKIVAPPMLSAFHFPSNLEEAMRTSVMCSVISGDPPITIEWLKDGQIISDRSHGTFQIVSITEFVSSLIIENLTRHHSGNYTCRAFNQYSSSSHSAMLIVKTKPFFVLYSSPQTSIAEASIVLDCQADGQPQPVIRWKHTPMSIPSSIPSSIEKSESSLSGEQAVAILSSPRVHVLENGSLMIRSLIMSDEGMYHCEANNGFGKGISVSTYLKVYEPPKIRPTSSKNKLKRSEPAEMSCKVTGSFPIYIEWFKNGEKISSESSVIGNYVIREEENDKLKVSMLIISSASRNDTATFCCSAINFYGHANLLIKLTVLEPSDPPTNLQVIQIRSRSVTISWNTPFNGNSPITGFVVECRSASETWAEAKRVYLSESSANTAVINYLQPLTEYFLQMRAENQIGRSEASPELRFTTRMEAPKQVPENITAVPLDSKSIRIAWMLRDTHVKRQVDGFYIGHKIAASPESFTFNTMHVPAIASQVERVESEIAGERTGQENDGPEGLQQLETRKGLNHFTYVIHSLQKSTKYALVIQAFNKEGEGPHSGQILAQTYANDPPKAPKLSFESSTTESASLTWSVHHDDRDSIHGFILSFKVEKYESNAYDVIKLPKNHRRYLFSNLLCGTKYIAKICAFNEVGRGEFSAEVKFVTEGSAPIAPSKQNFIKSNISYATILLSAWADGSCPIDHFEIQYKPQFQPEWILLSNHIIANHERVEIRDLIPGTWYDLLMIAKNEAGITEAKYTFATLTVNGGTVSPLLLSGDSGRVADELMILVPSVCAILVLLLVSGFAVYLLMARSQREANQSEAYEPQQTFDSVSLHSYNKTPKNEALYESQRVYCPSIYNSSGVAEGYRASPQQVHSCPGDGEYRTIMGGRVLRKGSFDHVYDLPHRYQKDNQAHIVIN